MPRNSHKAVKLCSHAWWRNEEGVTLLELMVAMAVSIVVIMAITNTMIGAGRSAVSVRLDSVTSTMLSQISTVLRDPYLCSRAFFVDLAGTTPLDVNPAAYPIDVLRFDQNGAYVARKNKFTSGVKVQSMTLDNPSFVAGARYRWTFKIRTEKKDEAGLGFGNTPEQIHSFRITITTKDGSPNYNITSCGIELRDPLSVAPPAIVMTRALLPPTATATQRADECTKISSDYAPATLLDLMQSGAAPGASGAVPAGAQPFLVAEDFVNSYILTHPNGLGLGTEIHQGGASSGQVACVHKTAPLRFTTAGPGAGANFQPDTGPAAHALECAKAFGPNYVAASFADLFQYGFRNLPAGQIDAAGFRDVTLEGSTNTCRVAFHAAANPQGLAIDCSKPTNQQNQIGCVIRSN